MPPDAPVIECMCFERFPSSLSSTFCKTEKVQTALLKPPPDVITKINFGFFSPVDFFQLFNT